MSLPEGWTEKRLDEILTPEQCDEIDRILKEQGLDDFERSNKLRRYLETLKEQLNQHEIVPGYLAYWLIFKQDASKVKNGGQPS